MRKSRLCKVRTHAIRECLMVEVSEKQPFSLEMKMRITLKGAVHILRNTGKGGGAVPVPQHVKFDTHWRYLGGRVHFPYILKIPGYQLLGDFRY